MASRYKIIFKLGIFPALVYIFNRTIESLWLDFYKTYSVDTLSHFLGGLSVAYSIHYALSLLEKKGWLVIKRDIVRVGIIVTAVMTIAVLWEFYEFISDNFFGTAMQPNSADMIKDLAMGMIGAKVFSVIAARNQEKK